MHLPLHKMLRDALGKPCPYCQNILTLDDPKRFPTRDHVIPQARKGQYKIVVCLDCNSCKKNFTIKEWLDRLLRGGDPRAKHVSAFIAARPHLFDAPPAEKPEQCPTCKRLFWTPEGLSLHMRDVHHRPILHQIACEAAWRSKMDTAMTAAFRRAQKNLDRHNISDDSSAGKAAPTS